MDVLRCPAILDRLQEIQDFVQIRAKEMGVPAGLYGKLALVMEELAVNVMHYAYPDDPGEISIGCQLLEQGKSSRFCVQLRDQGQPFNPLTGQAPDTQLSVEDRPVGGLGIFLAREMTDHISYERDEDSNLLTFCFDLPKSKFSVS